jgi:hypothetical protein
MNIERRQALAGLLTASLPLPLGAAPLSDAKTYAAVAMQLAARSVERAPDRATARRMMMETIDTLGPKLRAASIFIQQ